MGWAILFVTLYLESYCWKFSLPVDTFCEIEAYVLSVFVITWKISGERFILNCAESSFVSWISIPPCSEDPSVVVVESMY